MLVAVEEQQVIAFNKNEDKNVFILEQQALHNKTRKKMRWCWFMSHVNLKWRK